MKGLILLIVLLVISGSWIYENQIQDKMIDVGKFEIASRQLKSITDPLPVGPYILCSLEEEHREDACVLMEKIDLDS